MKKMRDINNQDALLNWLARRVKTKPPLVDVPSGRILLFDDLVKIFKESSRLVNMNGPLHSEFIDEVFRILEQHQEIERCGWGAVTVYLEVFSKHQREQTDVWVDDFVRILIAAAGLENELHMEENSGKLLVESVAHREAEIGARVRVKISMSPK